MRRKNYLFLAAATLVFAACDKKGAETPDNGPVAARITASADGPQTRAIDNKWEADAIGVMVNASTSGMKDLYKNVKYTTTSTGTTADFTAESGKDIYFQDANETVTFAAYGPYCQSESNALPGESSDGVIWTSTENQNTDETRQAVDFIYASGSTASKSSPTVKFKFKHVMSRLVLKVLPGNDISTSDITGGKYFLKGVEFNGKFDVTTGKAEASPSQLIPTQMYSLNDKVQVTPNESDKRTFTIICFPFDYSGRVLEFTATINGQDYKLDIKPNLEGGKSYTYEISVNKTKLEVLGSTIESWGNGGTTSGEATM